MDGTSWRDLPSEIDRQVFAACGYGRRIGFGRRPAVLVIDVNYNFLGDKPEPILESIRRFPYSCGEAGWQAVGHLKRLLEAARRAGVPVAYSTGVWTDTDYDVGILGMVNTRHRELTRDNNLGPQIIPDVAPQPGDILIAKHYPSMFLGTPLISYLTFLHVDTLLITGCTTSGCVRATAVDAYSYNFRPIIVEECVFDRSHISHQVALLDLDMKYGDVVSISEAIGYLERLPGERPATPVTADASTVNAT